MDDDEYDGDDESASLDVFIDDSEQQQQEEYQPVKNVTLSKEEEMLLPGTQYFEDNDEPKNYVIKQELFDDETNPYEYDDFDHFEKKIENFENDLLISEKNSEDSFYHSILYPIRFEFTDKSDFTTDLDEIKNNISEELFNKLSPLKASLKLDLIISHLER